MTEKYIFADVEMPFHIWVKEGGRWVLRDAEHSLMAAGISCRAEPSTACVPWQESPRP